MSQKEVYEFNVPTFGPGVVFDVDHKTRAEQFRFFGDALKSSRLASYVPHFVSEARAYFAQWGDEGVVDLKDALAELIILTASRTLMGAFFIFFFHHFLGQERWNEKFFQFLPPS
jgi:sterol 14alpha-demethylase